MGISSIIIGSASKEEYGHNVLLIYYYNYSLVYFRPGHFGIEEVVTETLKRANSIQNCKG